ncbi:MAG: lamin tail domain-containing protein [Verrucomicrobia bacterium]|nr:lamin tail domain-containing protein [Verrucomicrobiota bacterium]
MLKQVLRAALLVLLASTSVTAQAEIIIASNSVWAYFKGTSEASDPFTAWRAPGFDDSAWLRGATPFYFGKLPNSTNLTGNTLLSDMHSNYNCIFLRHTFVITNVAQVTNCNFAPVYDDGFVAWINGVEIKRSSSFTNPVPYYTNFARNVVNPSALPPVSQVITNFATALQTGTNVLAIQAFNSWYTNTNNLDFYFEVEFRGGFKDMIAPLVTAIDPVPGSTVTNLVQVAVTFSEAVANVQPRDLLINRAAAQSAGGSGSNWVFSFPVPPEGAVSVGWNPTNGIVDLGGNALVTIPDWQYTSSVAPPYAVAITPASDSTVTNLTQLTVTFSDPVLGVAADDLLINGSPAFDLSGSGVSYTFSFPQPALGPVYVSWDPGHAIRNLVGLRFVSTNVWQYLLIDQVPPTLAFVHPTPGATIGQLTQAEVTFSEPVTGVDAQDLLVKGAPATAVSGSGAGPYLFQFARPADGSVVFSWAAGHGIRDWSATPNTFVGGGWTNTLVASNALGRLIINEFLANNAAGISNEFGEQEDWIEIYNPGPGAVNLLGWSLTDDTSNPSLWTFPALIMNAGQYLVVFADARNLKAVGGTNRLHTNFKLNDQAGYLALFNPNSPRAVATELAPQYPGQWPDYSYGLNTSNLWSYFTPPTPGAANGSSAIYGVAPQPHVNVKRGLYDQPFSLQASCPLPGATLRYTTDGSAPTAATGTLYSGPVTITNTTIFRIAAFATNVLPSRVETHSYIFIDQVLRQPNDPAGFPAGPTVFTGYPSDYEMDPEIVTNNQANVKAALLALPTLSLSAKNDDLFGPVNGIYTHPEPPAAQRYLWERACSVEFILTNGETGFQVDCGVRIQGNASRTPQKTPKHPFRLMFRGAYGPGRLEYPVYPDSQVRSFDTLVLRADFNNSWVHWDANQRLHGSKLRDAWTKETGRAMSGLSGHTRWFHLYVDGLYWGVYDFGERIDAEFGASYLGGTAADYDAIASKPLEAIDGTLTAYTAMTTAGRSTDMRQITNYNRLQELLDVPVFIDYMLLNHYGANQDWGYDGNWNAVRRRSPAGTFKYIPWDGEQLIVDANHNLVTVDANGRPTGVYSNQPSGLHTNLINSPQYRLDYADRVHRYCFNNGLLTPGPAADRWMTLARMVEPGMLTESARWGDYRRDVHSYSSAPYYLYTTNGYWWPEIERVRTSYFPQRTSLFLNQLRTAGLYPTVSAPVFSQHGGRVARNYALTMTATNPIFFTLDGTDPRLYGSGAISNAALFYTNGAPVILTEGTTVKARALFNGTNWSALNEAAFVVEELVPSLRITELMYNPSGGDAYEFIEIQNTGSTLLDVSGYSFENLTFAFPVGSFLSPGERLVLGNGSNTNLWRTRYPTVAVAGWYAGSLKNDGERIAIKDVTGRTITSVTYDDQNGWPAGADGRGYSLELVDPSGDPNAPASWRASTALNGTPAVAPSSGPPAAVVLNELMADNNTAVENAGTYPDWIELFNSGPANIDLAGWSLTDDGNVRQFVFPATNLAPGNFLVVWCDDPTNTMPGLHTGFALNREGENVFLFDAQSNLVDAVSFGLQAPDYSLGRLDGAWQLNTPTPGAPNSAAPVGLATNLTINEYLADSPPGGADWLELYNRSTTLPVPLQDIYLGTSNALFRVKALSFLPPRGYIQLFADEEPGPDHLDFKLPAEGATLLLFDTTGSLVDRIPYGPQLQGVAQGRIPNGFGGITNLFGSASPGASNYLATYTGAVLNEVLARNRRAVASPWGEFADFVEIANPSASAFDLSGMGLSDSPGNPNDFLFPAGTVIEAGGTLLVWCDDALPPSFDASGPLNTGFALNASGGGVYLFNVMGQLVNYVEYGVQVPDLSIGLSGGAWQLLSAPTPGAANAAPAALGAAANLRFNEWLADPQGGDDWFELYNLDPLPVNMSGLYLSDEPTIAGKTQFPIPLLSFIGGHSWVQWIADGHPSNGRDHVNFMLDGAGDTIWLYNASLQVIDWIGFGLQTAGVSQGRLPDGHTNVMDFPASPSPADGNYLPLPGVVINEVLAGQSNGVPPSIELLNTSTNPVGLGGWFLSDSASELKKFRIADGETLGAGELKVFTAAQFGPTNGPLPGFALDPNFGGTVYLTEAATNGTLTGYRAQVAFGAQESGVSAGRFSTSVGVDFPAQSARTFGAANAYPRVGPVIISELMYHPVSLVGSSNWVEYGSEEYVELYNATSQPVPLFDPAHPSSGWRLTGGVRFNFQPDTVLPAKGYLLVVDFDPAFRPDILLNFRAKYGEYGTVVGPYSGHLANDGEVIELLKPLAPQISTNLDNGFVPYVLADRVAYSNLSPWPTNAGGAGLSLQRVSPALYGNEPLNWTAAAPSCGRTNAPVLPPLITAHPQSQSATPGTTVTLNVAASGPGPLFYQWVRDGLELAGGTNDLLTLTNVQPASSGFYWATVWNDAGYATSQAAELFVMTQLKLGGTGFQTNGVFQFEFPTVPNQPYAVFVSTNLTDWTELWRFTATNESMPFLDATATNEPARFYRAGLLR